MNLIQKILQSPALQEQPLVLIDIGASGGIHPIWKQIAPFATCIAFDADDRDFDLAASSRKDFKQLLIKRSLVSDQILADQTFYLTASPHCSSLLKPNNASLANWSYAPSFEVTKTIQLPTTTIAATLEEFNIKYIDWYKSDSQGIDLRLFKSLPDEIRAGITVAEFEPGIVDAYEGEDKVKDMLNYQDQLNLFWLAKLEVKGRVRVTHEKLNQIIPNTFLQKVLGITGPTAPGWAEMTYLNNFNGIEMPSKRSLLVGWLSAILVKQYGFAYDLGLKGHALYGDIIFEEMKRAASFKLKASLINSKYFSWIANKINSSI